MFFFRKQKLEIIKLMEWLDRNNVPYCRERRNSGWVVKIQVSDTVKIICESHAISYGGGELIQCSVYETKRIGLLGWEETNEVSAIIRHHLKKSTN